MTADPDLIRRWAAAQASSLRVAGFGSAAVSGTAEPGAAALASFSETFTWETGDAASGAGWCTAADGRLLLAVGESHAVRIWDPATGQPVRTLSGHTSGVHSVAGADLGDGRPLLATGSDDGTARIWDVETGELIHRLGTDDPNPTWHMNANVVAWARPAGGRPLLAVGRSNGSAEIHEPGTGETIRTLGGHAQAVYCASWGHGRRGELLLATGDSDGLIRIWDTSTWETLHLLNAHNQAVRAVAWATRPGGQLVLASAGFEDEHVRLWSAGDDGEFTAKIVDPGQGPLRTVLWIPLADGRTLLAGCGETTLFVLDGRTLELLHTQPADFKHRGIHNIDWALASDGSLLLAATSNPDRVHVWRLALKPLAAPAGAPSTILDPPVEITPGFPAMAANRMACLTRSDGSVLLVTSDRSAGPRVWSLLAGQLMHAFESVRADPEAIAFGQGPDGRVMATVGGADGSVRVFDCESGALVRAFTAPNARSRPVYAVSWGYRPDGLPMLATGHWAGGVRIWDPETATLIREFATGDSTFGLAWGYGARGQPLLASGSLDGQLAIWDPDASAALHTFTLSREVNAVAWARLPDGRSLVTAPDIEEGCVRMWDPETGELVRSITGLTRPAGIAWGHLAGRHPILAVRSREGGIQIWDQETGIMLAPLQAEKGYAQSLAWATAPNGDLLLVVADNASGTAPVRVWRVAAGADPPASGSARAHAPAAARISEVTRGLLRLGGDGLWLPLGLLADLVELTGPDSGGALPGNRVGALAGEQGIGRLRELGWPAPARVAFAALLSSGLSIPEDFVPPPQASPARLRDALTTALAGTGQPGSQPQAPLWPALLAQVRGAASKITGQTVTLLRILGQDACTADPLLPVRLAHRVPDLPALAPRQVRLLAPAGTRSVTGRAVTAGTLTYAPATVGLARTGPLTRLLPTQLALPRDLLMIRLAERQLLYRQHHATIPPGPEPVTIILDTTPPTFGRRAPHCGWPRTC